MPEVAEPKLEPPDLMQCQALKPNGNSFMTLGGVPGRVRCSATPTYIAYEREPGKDGQKGSMSLCSSCVQVMLKQMGEGFADIKPICTTYNLMVQVDVQGQQPEEFGEAVRSWVACALEEETEGQGWADMLDNFSEDYEEVVAPSPCVSTDLVEDRPTVGADIDLSKFYNAHLGVPYEPNEDERKLQEIAEHYIEQTDKYDEIVCSGRRYGEACPANSHERVAINKNARLVFQGCLATVEHTTPFHAEDLRREIQRQSRRR